MFSPVAFAQEVEPERLTVPLSDPSKPVTLSISLVQGNITAEAYEGEEVLIEARSRRSGDGRRARPDRQGMRRIPNTSLGLTVEQEHNVVRASAESWSHGVDVAFKVPVRTSVKLKTVNEGEIRVVGVAGEHELSNVNGDVTALDVAGTVVAETVNGDVEIRFRGADAKPMAFSTLNGDVDLTFPATHKADLRLHSGRGEIYTDFDMELVEKPPKVKREADGDRFRIRIEKEVLAKMNGGGPEIFCKTFNGDILIRKK